MTAYVIDASVAVKWGIEETYCPEALLYLNTNVNRIAPDFILFECSSAIQKKVWQGELENVEAWSSYELIFEEEALQLRDTQPLIKPAFKIANELSHSIYDCYYLALAFQEMCVVVTADRKFYQRVLDSAYRNYMTWIENPPRIDA